MACKKPKKNITKPGNIYSKPFETDLNPPEKKQLSIYYFSTLVSDTHTFRPPYMLIFG